jgi:hypothetical protein
VQQLPFHFLLVSSGRISSSSFFFFASAALPFGISIWSLLILWLCRKEFQLKGTIHVFRQPGSGLQVILTKTFARKKVNKGILTDVEFLSGGH